MNIFLFIFFKWCLSDNPQLLTHSGFYSIKLNPKETIEFNNINAQSIFLFTNPDPRIFKLEIHQKNNEIIEPFSDNAPVLDFIKNKFNQGSNNTISNKNSKLLSEGIEENTQSQLNNNINEKINNRNNNDNNSNNNNFINNNANNNQNYNSNNNNINGRHNINNDGIPNKDTQNNQFNQVRNENNLNNGNNNNQNNNENNNNQFNNEINNNGRSDQINNADNNRNNNQNNNQNFNNQNNHPNNNFNNQIHNENNNNNNNRYNQNTNENFNNQNNQHNNDGNNQFHNDYNRNNIHPDKPKEISEKDLVFGLFIGSRGYKIKITAIDSNSNDQQVIINFYYLEQKTKAYQIYLSTYPNDVFGIGKSPEGFDVCKIFNKKLISYWNVPGETVYYETSSINQSKTSKVSIMSDNKNLITYPSVNDISKTKVTGEFFYFDWISDINMIDSFYKVLIRNKKTVSNYVDKYKSEGIERYSAALNDNIFTILPPTRYQFIRPMYINYITAKHRYGQFSRKKDTIPLTSLKITEKNDYWKITKIGIIVGVFILVIVLALLSTIDKVQSVSYSVGFGDGNRRKVRRRKSRKDHKSIKDPQNNSNNFGLEYYLDGNNDKNDLEEEEDSIDDGNLSVTKKKKRSPEMKGIMEKILENKK